LASLGFYKQPGREAQEQFFRDVFARASLSVREAAYLGDLFSKAARLGRNRMHDEPCKPGFDPP
jgi:tRNA/rRNA methyltransferase/tRNA (cytidine32/uridine32-2'-O)-methyltransferase